MKTLSFIYCGIGAAGSACTKMLMAAGVTNIIGVDRQSWRMWLEAVIGSAYEDGVARRIREKTE